MEGQTLRMLMIICVLLCSIRRFQCNAAQNERVVNIGVVLNYNSWVGKVAKTAIKISAEDINRDTQLLNGSRLVLHFRDSRGDAIEGASAALNLLEREVVAIIGPQKSEVADFVSQLGEAAQVPVVSFSATDPLLSNHRYPYFVRMAHSDALQMHAIAALVQAFGWRRVIAVYPDDEFGTGAITSLTEALRDVGSELEYISAISPIAERQAIREELYKLMSMQSRVFVAHMHSTLGSRIFMEAHELGMMDAGYVWITTDGYTSLWDVLLNDSTMESMQGLLGVKTYIQNSSNLEDFTRRWKRQFRLEYPDEEKAELNIYGLFAYDAVWMIARAIGNLGTTGFNFWNAINPPPFVVGNTTDSIELKVFHEGPQLLGELLKTTNFRGLSGVVQIHDGEIVGSTYEIVNVVGNGYHVVGYWNNETQLSKQPSSQNNTIAKLRPVIWPGGSTSVPRGWVQPTSGKRMKIGVPIKDGLDQFVTVKFDRGRNESKVTGFCIDVFDAVLSRLDYALPYDLIPYAEEGQNNTQSYNDLVYQVYLKKFDAVVGDTTILANRSMFVDFTQPFTEPGFVMVVPAKTKVGHNTWAFMLPFTPGMWRTTGVFFVCTGIVIWLLEHKRNSYFRGKPKDQVVTLLWFSFSTLYFTHREKLVSSLSQMVIIIWLFVVLILKSSYTASLISIFTVQQLELTVEDVGSLRASGVAVGYQEGSFIGEVLQGPEFGISKENLRTYSTPALAGEALSNGYKNGGVAAIFDEIPNVRIFLASQCGYTTVGPIYRTGGFGFVFPKGSPLVSDISRAVLSLSEDKELKEIEAKWFNSIACTDSGANVTSNRLGIDIFWGLYAITGGASLIALIICIFRLLYDFKRDPNVKRHGEMVDQTAGTFLKSLYREMKLFLNYCDQKEGSTSAPMVARISESPSNSPCSTPAFTTSPSTYGTSPFRTSTFSRGSFSFRNHEHVPDANENTNARSSSISEPEITEEIPPSTTQSVSVIELTVDIPINTTQ